MLGPEFRLLLLVISTLHDVFYLGGTISRKHLLLLICNSQIFVELFWRKMIIVTSLPSFDVYYYF